MKDFSVEVAASDVVALDKNFTDLSLIHRAHEIAIDNTFVQCTGTVKCLEKPNHDKTDNEPKREVLIKLIQGILSKVTEKIATTGESYQEIDISSISFIP